MPSDRPSADGPGQAPPTDGQARVCPACDYRAELPAELFCPRDGAYLVTYADLKESEHDPLMGRRIADFAIVARIGSGGMGTVYRAIQIGMDRTVALKVLRPALTDDPQVVQRFLQEARATARLQHRNLAITYTSGSTDDGLFYIAMEYIAGGSLADLIHKSWVKSDQGPVYALEPARALRLFCQIVAALSHAHRLGIVHRDLKPDNVLLSEDEDEGEQAKIVDFGIAKILQGPDGKGGLVKTDAHTNLGTALYMAPERFGGAPGDPRMDVYSLGLLLHEMVTGLLPFGARYEDRDTPTVLLHKRLTTAVPPLHLPGDISPQLLSLHAELLDREPVHRPATASDVRMRLRDVPEFVPFISPEISGRMSVPSRPPVDVSRGDLAAAIAVGQHPLAQTPARVPRAPHASNPPGRVHTPPGGAIRAIELPGGDPRPRPLSPSAISAAPATSRASAPSSGSFPGPGGPSAPTPTPPALSPVPFLAAGSQSSGSKPAIGSSNDRSDSQTANVQTTPARTGPLGLSLFSWLLAGCAVLLLLLVLLILS